MTTKEIFADEEWRTLTMGPLYAGMLVIASDVGIFSMLKETASMMKAYTENEAPEQASELVGAMKADLKEKAENKEKLEAPDTKGKDAAAIESEFLGYLADAARIVDEKVPEAEASGYKEWVAGIAVSVAESGKEGGFLGIDAVRVSDKEKAAIEKIRNTLGLPLAN